MQKHCTIGQNLPKDSHVFITVLIAQIEIAQI